ncbi:C-GCAxxG-C-C family protein [Tissierella sp. Yu-01]|uniref:C-GCAxxG-C-C family protein n=1 Tax=Tissierella sp. Yu-01 TaxID=3035694 RepID=UPI00240D6C69|nr:C-GCAxxG-C-C family protein [Tissierella sp. Yu-01]WFA08195.1 C-GCAxxG-C-C family protein [Tissierella sp. Yu-01]
MTLVNTKEFTKDELLDRVTKDSEELFRTGTYFCSESVVQTINELLGMPYGADVVKLASGFPIGMGKAGCLCGAVSGGQMALGMAYGRVEGEPMPANMFEISKKLHDYIMDEYKSNCCRVITKQWKGDNFASPERKAHCITITGKVARWIANELIKDGKIEVKSEVEAV